MSSDIERDAGQVLCVGYPEPEPPAELVARVGAGEVGGVILFTRNAARPPALARITRELAAAAPADRPLLLAVDQEGGRVQRLADGIAKWPPMRRLGELADEQLSEAVGRAVGDDLRLLGFNVDFAPVLDVLYDGPAPVGQGGDIVNTVIGDRAFGSDAETVSVHALAFARGLHAAGVLACGKHFPGHGGPVADSHVELPIERRDREQLGALDLAPFEAAARADMPMFMSAHVLYPALGAGELPGTLSEAVSTTLLRERVGFEGVLVSDCLEMRAISDHWDFAEVGRRALMAGVDLLLICHTADRQRAARAGIIEAARSDAAVAARLAEAAGRVAALKRRLSSQPPLPDDIDAALAPERHSALLQRLEGERVR